MAHTAETTSALHGVMAEYDDGQSLVEAAKKTMAQGFTRVEAYSPVPIEDLNTIIHKSRTVLPKLILAGGLTGMATGFALQYWAQVIEYPMNIGGRPLASWTTFIVPSLPKGVSSLPKGVSPLPGENDRQQKLHFPNRCRQQSSNRI